MQPSTPLPFAPNAASVSEDGPTWFHDQIEYAPGDPTAARDWPFQFRSAYQGEAEWMFRGLCIRFRSAKCPWRFTHLKPDDRYWNYPDRASFEKGHNGNHGLVTAGAEPVDADTLELFRRHVHMHATTGFFCHHRNAWVRCKPTARKPSYKTWTIVSRRAGRGDGMKRDGASYTGFEPPASARAQMLRARTAGEVAAVVRRHERALAGNGSEGFLSCDAAAELISAGLRTKSIPHEIMLNRVRAESHSYVRVGGRRFDLAREGFGDVRRESVQAAFDENGSRVE